MKTSKGKLVVQAEHQSKNKSEESTTKYTREYSIPEGVVMKEMTCKYTDEGALIVEAPYINPVNKRKARDSD